MNNRVEEAFQGKKAFIPFVTCGDSTCTMTVDLVLAMAEAGADLVELGIPFSDPVAEGPVIQQADERALKAGFKLNDFFHVVEEIRRFSTVPLVCMTYLNPVYHYGKDRFLERSRSAGLDGIIIPDLPYEERDELAQEFEEHSIVQINMIAPTSRKRITEVASHSKGFLYCVSSMGVTGMRSVLDETAKTMVAQAKEVSSTACAVGFGIHSEEQARTVASYADGVIVGSAIVNLIAKHGSQSVDPVYRYVQSMKKAIRG